MAGMDDYEVIIPQTINNTYQYIYIMKTPKFQFSGILEEQENQIMGSENKQNPIMREFGDNRGIPDPQEFTQQQETPMGLDPNIPPNMPAVQEDRQIAPQGENPFAAEQYNNVNLPDQPLSFGGGMAEQLLNDNEVPEKTRRKFWWVFHKDNTLTFLDDKRKASKLLNFDIAKIDMLNCIPYYDYTFDKELEFGLLRNVMETKLDRALGFKGGNVKNERIMLQSQFSENRQISEQGSNGPIKEGFFKRLLGRR